MSVLRKLFGLGPKVDLAQEIANGAKIIDVRSKAEYASGHVKGSVNIPLEQLEKKLNKFSSKDVSIITCCASGMRSGVAKSMLKKNGFENVHNGGSWTKVQSYKNRA
jgi:rhodanese-related sulfurtransferase